ncbi:MAG: hypothetical protein ACREA4_01790 [Nitrososphaera sp.]
MAKSDGKPLLGDEERLKTLIAVEVASRVAHEIRPMRMMVDSALDTLEFYQKSVNLRLGALLGHDTKKKQAAAQITEIPVFESADLNEALRVSQEIKGKRPVPQAGTPALVDQPRKRP